MAFPPDKITIKSDGNVLTYKNFIKPIGTTEKQYVYSYTKSKTKKGTLLGLNEAELIKLINANT